MRKRKGANNLFQWRGPGHSRKAKIKYSPYNQINISYIPTFFTPVNGYFNIPWLFQAFT